MNKLHDLSTKVTPAQQFWCFVVCRLCDTTVSSCNMSHRLHIIMIIIRW